MKTTRTIFEFFIALVVILLIALAAYVALVYSAGTWTFFSMDKIGNGGSFLSGVLGSAVALAGAFVAIKLAAHALQLQLDQESRENVKSHFEMLNVVSQHFEGATRSITDVMRGIQAVYVSAINCETLLLAFLQKYTTPGEDVQEKLAHLSPEMKRDIEEIRMRGTEGMAVVMAQIAAKCRDNPAVANPITAVLLNKIAGKKFAYGEFMVSMSEMQLWAAFFQNKADALAKTNQLQPHDYMRKVIAARVYTLMMVDKAGKKFDDRGLRSFLLMGSLCDFNKDLSKVIVNFYSLLPKADDMLQAMQLLLPTKMAMSPGLIEVLRNFDMHAYIDPSFAKAIESYRVHDPRFVAHETV